MSARNEEVESLEERIQKSTRLRYTLDICELVGIKYDVNKVKYGGFFSTFQLDKIKAKLLDLKRLQAEIGSISKKGA